MNFENIYELARKAKEQNKLQYAGKQRQRECNEIQQEERIKENRVTGFTNANYETDCYSKPLLNKIKECGFTIDSYEKFDNFDDEDDWDYYNRTLENYYCSLNNWNFKINNHSDVDISQGIWALRDIENKVTSEKIDFYCDLGCKNTSQARLDDVLRLFQYNSLNEFIENEYKKYLELPNLLRENNCNVIEHNYSFSLNEPKGYLELEKGLYIKIYRAWMDNFHLVVTNKKGWDVNSGAHSYDREKAYYFEYNSQNDISELIKCIQAFKDEQEGEIGYFENERYYNTYNVKQIFDNLRDKNDYYKDCWNNYLIQVEHKDYWDGRGYNKDSKIINKYEGLEIYLETELTFNDAAQWSEGDLINKSLIIFEYDRRKSDKCKLEITNYIYSHNEEYSEWTINPEKIQDKIELYGDFSELASKLKEYINIMVKIHEISL